MDELHRAYIPLVKILSFFGFFPYNVEPNGKPKMSWLLVGYVVTLFGVADYLIFLQYLHMNEYIQQGSFLSQFSFLFIVVMVEVFILIVHILNYVNLDVLGLFLSTLYKFDEEVSESLL